MYSPADERVMALWLKAAAATDAAEVESLLWDFRDVLHEYLDQCRGQKSLLSA